MSHPQVFLVSELATGKTKHIELAMDDKIEDLKTRVAKHMDIPKAKQVLFMDGEILDSDLVVKQCAFRSIAPVFVMDLRKSPDADPEQNSTTS